MAHALFFLHIQCIFPFSLFVLHCSMSVSARWGNSPLSAPPLSRYADGCSLRQSPLSEGIWQLIQMGADWPRASSTRGKRWRGKSIWFPLNRSPASEHHRTHRPVWSSACTTNMWSTIFSEATPSWHPMCVCEREWISLAFLYAHIAKALADTAGVRGSGGKGEMEWCFLFGDAERETGG